MYKAKWCSKRMLSDIPQSRQWIKQTYPSQKWHQIPVETNKRDWKKNVEFTVCPSIYKMPIWFQSVEVTVKWQWSFGGKFFFSDWKIFLLYGYHRTRALISSSFLVMTSITSYNPRQKSLKHPFPLYNVETTFHCLTGHSNIAKGRGTKMVRERSKCFKFFVKIVVVRSRNNLCLTWQ